MMTENNKSERNDRGKCLIWPVTSYGPALAQGFCSWVSEFCPSDGQVGFQGKIFEEIQVTEVLLVSNKPFGDW